GGDRHRPRRGHLETGGRRESRGDGQGLMLDATALACTRCDSCDEVTKYSREHTITRRDEGRAPYPELGAEPPRFATARSETLTAAVRAAFDDGLIDARERGPGT